MSLDDAGNAVESCEETCVVVGAAALDVDVPEMSLVGGAEPVETAICEACTISDCEHCENDACLECAADYFID
jgi:hypothetical protein